MSADWAIEIAGALATGRPNAALETHLEQLLLWLSGPDQPRATALASAVTQHRLSPERARQAAYRLLDRLLFDDHLEPGWRTLGLAVPSDARRLKHRYRRLIQVYHPDRHPDETSWATRRTEQLNRAYQRCAREAAAAPAGASPRPTPTAEHPRRSAGATPAERRARALAVLRAAGEAARHRVQQWHGDWRSWFAASRCRQLGGVAVGVVLLLLIALHWFGGSAPPAPPRVIHPPGGVRIQSLPPLPRPQTAEQAPLKDSTAIAAGPPLAPLAQPPGTAELRHAEPPTPPPPPPIAAAAAPTGAPPRQPATGPVGEPVTTPATDAGGKAEAGVGEVTASGPVTSPEPEPGPGPGPGPGARPTVAPSAETGARIAPPAPSVERPAITLEPLPLQTLPPIPQAAPPRAPLAPEPPQISVAPRQLPLAPATSAMTADCGAASDLLARFQHAYEAGALEALMQLYSPAATENQLADWHAIQQTYAEWFVKTSSRQMRFDQLQVVPTADGQACTAIATYRVVYLDRQGNLVTKNGVIELRFAQHEGQLKILRVLY